ncbi:MAG: Uncharacterized protein Greene041619_602 [Candidatus Peregrinibacteria bacterium Greene0416_19]|nr:MAG: Uncharacterized protein Greene041619_602 [Candidatus Peregrinibacteria bacterium Greene0416_19]
MRGVTGVYILLAALLALSGYVAWKLTNKKDTDTEEADKVLREMLENMRKENQELRERDRAYIQERMDRITAENAKTMTSQFRQTADIIQKVTEKLTTLDATNKQVLGGFERLQDLETILKQPKGKGILSEYWLETMLGHVLQPGQYQMQYKFKNGEIVDAVVFFQEKIIPVDAKFSSEKYTAIMSEKNDRRRAELEKAFKNDLKLRIDETGKYIRPEESTTDFAFMFLPAEGIFYDLLVAKVGAVEVNRESLMEYAFSKRVVIVSPATFFAYLQTVLQGLKAFRMEESVRDIQKNIEQLGKHLSSYESFMQKMGTHLGTTVSMYDNAYREFKKIDKDIYKLTEGKAGGAVSPLLIDKPVAHVDDASENTTMNMRRKTAAEEVPMLSV